MSETIDITKSLQDQRAMYVRFRDDYKKWARIYNGSPLGTHFEEQADLIEGVISNIDKAIEMTQSA